MPPMAFTPRRHAGFTLIELMITILVMAILLGVGVPSFQNTIRDNSTNTAANEFANALAFAKSEAIKLSKPVTVCPRDAGGGGCGVDWSLGWLIFSEDRGIAMGAAPVVDINKIVAEGGELKRSQLTQLNAANNWVRFTTRGLLEEPVQFLTQPKPENCTEGALQKSISMALAGRISLETSKVEACL